MKKIFCFLFIPFMLFSCSKSARGYDELEKSLMGILLKKDENSVVKQLEKTADLGNEDVFGLAYAYLGETGEDFWNRYLKKSKGIAEFYKASYLQKQNPNDDQIIPLLESSAKQGFVRSYFTLGRIYEDKFEFEKAQEYLKKGKDAGDMYATYSYEYNKKFSNEYKKMENLDKKLKDGSISKDEKKELGTLVLEVMSDYEKAYDILKEFISEGFSPALYAKGKILESEDKEDEAVQLYNQSFEKDKYYLSAFELASKLVNRSKDNYQLALQVLDAAKSDKSVVLGYQGFIYENMKDYEKAEDYYQKAIQKGDVDVMNYLGRLYETKNELKKAKNIYNKAYQLGSIPAGYRLAYVLEEIEAEKTKSKIKDNVRKSKEAKQILEKLSENGDDYSTVDLSLYYPEKDKNIRILNLKAAAKLNSTAFYNLGVYYYTKNNKNKSKVYFRIAKDNGYDIGPVFEKFIEEK